MPQDHTRAAEWFCKAAEQGQVDAQYLLGGIYERGQGLPQNVALACEWYRKAAEQGHEGARRQLAALGAR